MSPLPLPIAQALVAQRQAELRSSAAGARRRRPRRLMARRLRIWAGGWIDRNVPQTMRPSVTHR